MRIVDTIECRYIDLLHSKRVVLCALGLLTFVLLLTSLRLSYRQLNHLVGHNLTAINSKQVKVNDRPSRDRFNPDLFDIEGQFDGSALRKVCNDIQWMEGLYFDCSNNSGGIGNMRNFILTCIRYTMEGGASLVMPTIRKRDPNHLEDLFTTHEPFAYMFDDKFFLDSMQIYCPQMKIVPRLASVKLQRTCF